MPLLQENPIVSTESYQDETSPNPFYCANNWIPVVQYL
jgi:hypothetical protein